MTIGENYLGNNKWDFNVWAPYQKSVNLHILNKQKLFIPMRKIDDGYWQIQVDHIEQSTPYLYFLDNKQPYADPASYFQPQGVLGPSALVDHHFSWSEQEWKNHQLKDYIIYECHIGTFTESGNFEQAIEKLAYLKDLGITAIELMPITAFPGKRNWGYDTIFPFAVQASYGGPNGLKKFVNTCHQLGIAVILDIIYNHIGPEGNIFSQFGPYFSNKYKTPWGEAINYDSEGAYGVRAFVIENAKYWFRNYHIDALRLDAIQTIFDDSPTHILAELSQSVERECRELQRTGYLIAESDLNDMKITNKINDDGFGLDANWCDDHHHAWHAWTTGERHGYYVDYGQSEQLIKTIKNGYWFDGQICKNRNQPHGNFTEQLCPQKLVTYIQNHDQIGNRMLGERLSTLIAPVSLRLMAAITIVSPYLPLLFMGEEYGETQPFLYFVDHQDERLLATIAQGRKDEFKNFNWTKEQPEPGQVRSFLQSKLDWSKLTIRRHQQWIDYHKKLISLRKQFKLSELNKSSDRQVELNNDQSIISVIYNWPNYKLGLIINISQITQQWIMNWSPSSWQLELDSFDQLWGGPGKIMPSMASPGDEISLPPQALAIFSDTK